jgi:hypothetical protein
MNRIAGSPSASRASREYNVSRKTIIRDLRDLIHRRQLPAGIYPEWNEELGAGD